MKSERVDAEKVEKPNGKIAEKRNARTAEKEFKERKRERAWWYNKT